MALPTATLMPRLVGAGSASAGTGRRIPSRTARAGTAHVRNGVKIAPPEGAGCYGQGAPRSSRALSDCGEGRGKWQAATPFRRFAAAALTARERYSQMNEKRGRDASW